ncbi:helix-turn-helix domain-containing protein [Paenibacillus macquariensis]|uniref:Helix-turn-helix n=1 Tax=Paenibacillus macquariensis TaxID=948756 RepID=A0ABY1KB69_9BACL|nr:Helix-turn-helix [Paenibacillus macquariensis]
MKIGNRIAELREQKGWTQEELSTLIGISRGALSHYEKSRRNPDFETLTHLADILQVSIDYLIGRKTLSQNTVDPPLQGYVE